MSRRRELGSRRRGATAIFTVIAVSAFIGAMVVAGAAAVGPHARAVRVRALLDQAHALAESGALVGRRAVARGAAEGVVLDGVGLGPGRLTVAVERAGPLTRVVSTASVDASHVSGPDQRLARTVVVTLEGEEARVVRWETR